MTRIEVENGVTYGYHPELFGEVIKSHPGVFDREGLKVVVEGLPAEGFARYWEKVRGDKNDIFCPGSEVSSFSPESVDVICLGFNLDFLDDSRLKAFFEQADLALAPDGLIVCLINDPLIPPLANRINRILGGPSFQRSLEGYRERTGGLFDLVYVAENCPDGIADSFACMVVFAKKGVSLYGEPFGGLPHIIAA